MTGIFLMIAAVALSQDVPQLTLADALAQAQASAFTVRVADSNIREAGAQETIAKAALGPSATLNGTSQYSETHTSGGFGQNGSNFSTSVNLTVRQLIDISRTASLRVDAAEYNTESLRAARDAELNTVRGLVKQKFFAALQAKELVGVREAAVKSTQERLEKIKIRFNEQVVAKFDVLRVEGELKKAEQDLIQAKGNYEFAKQDLNNLLARPIDTEFEPVGSPTFETELRDPLVYVRGSLNERPELRQANLSIQALEKLREVEQRAGLPTLNVQAGYGQNIDPSFGQPDRQTTASATLSIPIVTSGAIKANTQRARENEERAKILLEQLQLAVTFEVRVALTQWATAKATYDTAVQNRIFAEEAYRLAVLRYDEQVGILLDVTVAQSELTAARANEVVAAYQLRTAYAALQKAVGTDDLQNLTYPEPAAPATEIKEAPEKFKNGGDK